jgi:hypothetical protein
VKLNYWGAELDGFDHPYNTTILNERAVEISAVTAWTAGNTGAGLEVGNVLGHYGITGHRVVDKYEVAAGVDNLDVLEITGTYDWIVSISTLEHAGYDENPRDADKSVTAVEHLRSLLAPGGRMWISVPLGHNPTLDEYVMAGALGTSRDCTFVRCHGGWVQTAERTWLPYGATTIWAESVWLAEWEAR